MGLKDGAIEALTLGIPIMHVIISTTTWDGFLCRRHDGITEVLVSFIHVGVTGRWHPFRDVNSEEAIVFPIGSSEVHRLTGSIGMPEASLEVVMRACRYWDRSLPQFIPL